MRETTQGRPTFHILELVHDFRALKLNLNQKLVGVPYDIRMARLLRSSVTTWQDNTDFATDFDRLQNNCHRVAVHWWQRVKGRVAQPYEQCLLCKFR